jgi:putative transposase
MIIFDPCCKQPASADFSRSLSFLTVGLDNLKLIRSAGWQWLTRLEHNRHVNPDRTGNIPLNQVDIPQEGCSVHLKGYGMIKVFKIVKTDTDIEYWASSDLDMSDLIRMPSFLG